MEPAIIFPRGLRPNSNSRWPDVDCDSTQNLREITKGIFGANNNMRHDLLLRVCQAIYDKLPCVCLLVGRSVYFPLLVSSVRHSKSDKQAIHNPRRPGWGTRTATSIGHNIAHGLFSS